MTFQKTKRQRKMKQSQLFQIFSGLRMVVVVVKLQVGQKAERKLLLTQEMLLFWLWQLWHAVSTLYHCAENIFMHVGPTFKSLEKEMQ